jgi:hypothetical protein
MDTATMKRIYTTSKPMPGSSSASGMLASMPRTCGTRTLVDSQVIVHNTNIAMIHIFFVPGMFASTIEYVLRCYTEEYKSIDAGVLFDGSMHSYERMHPLNIDSIDEFFKNHQEADSITSPIYPFQTAHLPEILERYQLYKSSKDRSILLYAPDKNSAELNILFQYYKIATGFYNQGLKVYCDDNLHNIVKWNKEYTHWSQMQPWEWREWFSLFYDPWVNEWIDSKHQVSGDFFVVANIDILNNTEHSLRNIITFCGLTEKPGLAEFTQHWQSKQQYIIDEFKLLHDIIVSTTNNKLLTWSPISIVSESIVQQRLRKIGYEIRCDGLNIFPTNSETLYNLLEKC